ncbi:hypothetical protein Mal4_56420 [Maioricimonas rarisocia]|uniref:Uncharacterized protein n=1 Tax=Maioricimonas rarisocia TaxID=2528026 RepID=A0A517ZFM3_9PLAN|nr:hypothetical protein [Maioricimonas rarisocia]QDU41276.1 hypothetical protein Mal4_56420 [Maioricimonas rarisocia]
MADQAESRFDTVIDGLLADLEPPIRRRNQAEYARLAADLVERARQTADAAVRERLIQLGESIQSQWLPLAIREDVLQTWYHELEPLRRQFDRQYNLFVARRLNRTLPERWTWLFRQSLRVRFWDKRTQSQAEQMNSRIRPLLQAAHPDRPGKEEFTLLEEDQSQSIESQLDQVADALRRYHCALLEGLEMQQRWLDENPTSEPDASADEAR